MKVYATIEQEVVIKPEDAISALKEAMGFKRNMSIRNGELTEYEDTSYHGSSMIERYTISNNPKWIELYKAMKILEDYAENRDLPEWDKKISKEQKRTQPSKQHR